MSRRGIRSLARAGLALRGPTCSSSIRLIWRLMLAPISPSWTGTAVGCAATGCFSSRTSCRAKGWTAWCSGLNPTSINMRSTGSSALASPAPASLTRRSAVRTAAVGRVGTLTLEYVRRGDRTVFGRTKCQTPWHLLPPIYLDESGSAYTLLVNPSGGLVGGDRLSIDLSLAPKTHVLISTPSANRVYRSLSQQVVQNVTIKIAEGGSLEWMPEHTIPFAGSRFRQSMDVRLS